MKLGVLSILAAGLAALLPPVSAAIVSAAPAPSTLSAAQADLAHGRYRQAEMEFRQAIAQHQGGAIAYYGLGEAAVGLHDYGTAFDAFKHAMQLDPRNPIYVYDTANSAYQNKQFHVAVTYATTYIAMRPKDALGYHLRMLAYGSLLNRKQQLADAEQVVHLQPGNASAWNDLGIGLANNSEFKASIQAFSRAIQLAPRNASYHINRALVESLAKEPRAALKDLQAALSYTTDPQVRKRLEAAIASLKKHMH